ncbi:hypothetical protein KM043_016281 [Ampulex compressa]|nr:hypothetical protein KM043_016281 [Ampulex compressa]
MTSCEVEKVVKLYRSVYGYPSLTDARVLNINDAGLYIQSLWTQRNLERKTNQRFLQTCLLDAELKPTLESFPVDVTNEQMHATTLDEQYRAILRQVTIDNAQKQFIEIWDRQRLIKNYDLSAMEIHGDVYTDNEFSCFEWSSDNSKILYIAEKKLPKSEPFYKQKSVKKDKENNGGNETTVGNEHIYKPDWGEQLVGKHRPVVAVLDIALDTIEILSGIPDELSPGQALWTKDGLGVVGVARKHEPRHLGLVACTNRLSWIFYLKNGEYQKLSNDGCAVLTPRFSPDGKHLVWLEREVGGVHHNAHRLMYLDFESEDKEVQVVVNIIETDAVTDNGKKFHGLYGRLRPRCWSNDSRYVILSTPQQHNICSYIVDIKTKRIIEILNEEGSLSVLDIKNNIVTFLKTSLLSLPTLYVGKLTPETFESGNMVRRQLGQESTINVLDNHMYDCTEYVYDNDDEIKNFNFTYFGPKTGESKSVPFVVVPHGGPHSNFVNAFSFDYTFMNALGFAVVQVNYRGSTGMGSKNVEFLQGKVGDTDVKDCVTATQQVLAKYPWLNPDQIGLSGGSHGGFLVTHLSAQHPDLYKAVVARNPVIDIAAMYTLSDIPDWCNAEMNYPYRPEAVYNKSWEQYVEMSTKMLKASPIIHVNKVKAPTLLCIGLNDLRVSPSQGKLWYNRLKENNVKTKLLVYDDNHPLSCGVAEIDNVINACLWLMEHITPTKKL